MACENSAASSIAFNDTLPAYGFVSSPINTRDGFSIHTCLSQEKIVEDLFVFLAFKHGELWDD